jgi:hypothetical protein
MKKGDKKYKPATKCCGSAGKVAGSRELAIGKQASPAHRISIDKTKRYGQRDRAKAYASVQETRLASIVAAMQ